MLGARLDRDSTVTVTPPATPGPRHGVSRLRSKASLTRRFRALDSEGGVCVECLFLRHPGFGPLRG